MTETLRVLAPAKVNLGLFIGERRADHRHQLVTVMQPLTLADELEGEVQPQASGDRVTLYAAAVPAAEELTRRAVLACRQALCPDAPPLAVRVRKRIPLAAGLAGGSADAGAAIRLAAHLWGLRAQPAKLREVGATLGADVPAQVCPGRYLARGAGELLERLPPAREEVGVVVAALRGGLSTALVYRELDRQGALRGRAELGELASRLQRSLGAGAPVPDGALLENDLEAVACALRPEIGEVRGALRRAGASYAFVSGSGPTVVGLFPGRGGVEAAERAAALLERKRHPAVALLWAVRFAPADYGVVRRGQAVVAGCHNGTQDGEPELA